MIWRDQQLKPKIMKKLVLTFCFIWLLNIQAYADGKGFPLAPMAEYYVDFVNGNDSNPGTSAGIAFKTLARARDEVASINANMTGDIIVYLRKERHEIDATVLFDSNDSGTNGHHIIYRNYPNESPVLTGGVKN